MVAVNNLKKLEDVLNRVDYDHGQFIINNLVGRLSTIVPAEQWDRALAGAVDSYKRVYKP